MSKNDNAEIDYEYILGETSLAVQFEINGESVWLPKAVIEVDTDQKVITMPEKLALEKELI